VADLATNTVTVYGEAFGRRQDVAIGGVPANVVSSSPEMLVVQLPTIAAQPGTYLLRITRGNGGTDTFVFTVGGGGGGGLPFRRPDPPCYDNINRYIVCGNGTITDATTGLIWLQRADCLPPASFADAQRSAAGLQDGECGLTDGSLPGDWRLPTDAEWGAMIGPGLSMGCTAGVVGPGPPPLTNDAGTRCFAQEPASFIGVMVHPSYWTSSILWYHPPAAWRADLGFGDMNPVIRTFATGVWPVRSR
jgi:hypothetical protein